MAKLVRWQPMNDLVSLRDAMDRLFEDSWVSARGLGAPAGWSELAMDVYETANDVVVKAVVPGIKPEEVDITLTGNVLSIQGQSKEESETKDKNYLRRESRYGSFSRSLELPAGLQTDRAEARFDNGILTITLPKAEVVKPKTIKVKTGDGQPSR